MNILNYLALVGALFYPTPAIATTTPPIETVPVVKPLPTVLKNIAWCESRGKLDAANTRSSAKGKYQFLKGTWEYYGKKLWKDDWVNKDIFSEKNQDELALYVYKVNGTKDWEADPASYNCWSKMPLK